MGTIRIEAVPVQSYLLGLFGFDHLQLVYEDETDILNTQERWFVVEGIQDGPLNNATLGASGENGRLSLGVSNGAFGEDLVALIGTPEDRGSRIIYQGPDALSVWQQIAAYAGQIESQLYPYIAVSLPFSATPTINSSSLIGASLWSVGIDINSVLPFNLRLSPGTGTLLGTAGDDTLSIVNDFTTLATGPGNDHLSGSTNTLFLDKLYGGAGDDTIQWSYGDNVVHGGQPRLAYEQDGLDTVDLAGAGTVYIHASAYAIDHKVPDYFAVYEGGFDQWFSIEELTWNNQSDVLIGGSNVELIDKPLRINLEGDGGGRGDQLSLADGTAPLLINYAGGDFTSVQTLANAGLDAGYWVDSAEWISGSQGDDRIYSGPQITGVEGAGGDDLIDTRLASAFSGASPLGYDVEIDGGDGDDTIVVGDGKSIAWGGDGDDSFVVSSMSDGGETVELIIADATADDRLYIPYDLFLETRGTYEGSSLFQLSGAVFGINENNPIAYFAWGPPDDNQVEGNISFVGGITYEMDGDDLVISIMQGDVFVVDLGTPEEPAVVTLVGADEATRTIVRVLDWSEGDLGIRFPLQFDLSTLDQVDGDYSQYPGYTEALNDATGAHRFIDPLDERPDAYVPLEIASATTSTPTTATFRTAALLSAATVSTTTGGDGDDVLSGGAGGPFTLDGGAGNDTITGSDGGDVIIGGSGADTMAGGRGNDAYWIDDAGDIIIELAGGGFDKVYTSINYTLGDFVEYAVLEGAAVSVTGNELDNRILGNALDNVLAGGDGRDTLAGDLGDDTLIGGEDGDGYVYELGDGHDTIIETGTRGDDFIVLAGGLTFADVTLMRDPTHANDLTLVFADGGTLNVVDYFANPVGNIEGLTLASGATLDGVDFAAAAQAAVSTHNFAPVARPDQYVFKGGNSLVLPIAALLDNDSDLDGDTLTISDISNVTGGTAVLDGQGNLIVTRTGTSSTIAFDYTISDGAGGVASSTFEIAIQENGAPDVTSITVGEAVEDQITLGQIFGSDPENDKLIFALKDGAGPAKGSVVVDSDGHFTYTPNADANGAESFTVTLTDGFHAPTEAVVAFDIAAVNDQPIARDDSGFAVTAGKTLSIDASALLANDSDVDNDPLNITSVGSATGGTVGLGDDGKVTFTADANFSGQASFAYTVSDTGSGAGTAVVTIDVAAAPPPPSENIIIGTTGRDTLYSTAADDIFYGKSGRDTFVFRQDVGDDVIKDFEPGWWFFRNGDVLDLRGNGFDSYFELITNIHWSGHDTVISLPDGGSVTLEGILPIQLNIDNFKIF